MKAFTLGNDKVNIKSKVEFDKSSKAEHRQHKHNKQASNNHLDRLMDDEVEGWLKVKVEECKGVHRSARGCMKLLTKGTI